MTLVFLADSMAETYSAIRGNHTMRKYLFDFRWKPTRSQIMDSYRLSANKHPADQLGEDHSSAGTKLGMLGPEFQQQLRHLTQRLKRIT